MTAMNGIARVLAASLTAALLTQGCDAEIDVDEVRKQRSAWRAEDIGDYVFVYKETCYCDSVYFDGIRVVVRDHAVVSAVGLGTGWTQPGEDLTLEGIFDLVLSEAREDPYKFAISYDPEHHYVQHFSVDVEADTADDELTLTVTCFSEDTEGGCPYLTLSDNECAGMNGSPRPAEARSCAEGSQQAMGRIDGTAQVCCVPRQR